MKSKKSANFRQISVIRGETNFYLPRRRCCRVNIRPLIIAYRSTGGNKTGEMNCRTNHPILQ